MSDVARVAEDRYHNKSGEFSTHDGQVMMASGKDKMQRLLMLADADPKAYYRAMEDL